MTGQRESPTGHRRCVEYRQPAHCESLPSSGLLSYLNPHLNLTLQSPLSHTDQAPRPPGPWAIATTHPDVFGSQEEPGGPVVSSPVKETLLKENFGLPIRPDTWRAGGPGHDAVHLAKKLLTSGRFTIHLNRDFGKAYCCVGDASRSLLRDPESASRSEHIRTSLTSLPLLPRELTIFSSAMH